MSQQALDTIKEVETKAFGFKKYFDAVVNIASGGVTANIVRGVGILLLTIGWFIVRAWLRKIRIDMAAQLTEEERKNLQLYLDKLNGLNDDIGIDDLDRAFGTKPAEPTPTNPSDDLDGGFEG